MSIIRIPIDASAIPAEDRGKQSLRVAAQMGERVVSTVVKVNSGRATAELEMDAAGAVTIAVGPESSRAADLFRQNTITVTARPQSVDGRLEYTVKPIVVTLPFWNRWLFWCRTFTISGYVYGPDGNPVPSAQVSAFNVDWFWWWSSTGQVGSTVLTDPNGYFTIDFTWCCGWWPWYWWELRNWRLDPFLVEKIQSVLKLSPALHVGPPSLELTLNFSALNPQPLPPGARKGQSPFIVAEDLNPSTLPAIREKLVNLLPTAPEFERFCLWPWCPWTPWFDCDPNIIFQVTQSCGGPSKVILSENVWQARIDIPTNLNVTLTTSADACTIPPNQGQPDGACFLFTAGCSVPASDIGLTGSGALAGFADPGSDDRPFTGPVSIFGQFGYTAADLHYADYYTLQYRPEGSATWLDMPAGSLQQFTLGYFDATKMWPHQWFYPIFSPTPMPLSGSPGEFATVYESTQFYELSNPTPPNDWGDVLNGQSWTYNIDLIALVDTATYFTDGAYEFQVVGYTLQPDGTISSNGALPGCGKPDTEGVNDNNDFTLFFANPTVGETTPDSAINSVSFNGSLLPPCGIQTLPSSTPFSFAANFTASDAEGYLDSYVLSLQWGTNSPVALFSCGCVPTCGLSLVSGAEVGPCYADAIAQGAVRPVWNGGTMNFTVPDASALFPASCAYDLILNVYKRNIVDCDTDEVYQETQYYSFTVLFA
jgi:hypothetical protein